MIKDEFDNPDYLLRKAALLLENNQRADAEKTLSIVRNFINDDAGKLIAFADQARNIGNNDWALNAMARAYEIATTSTFVTLRYTSLLLDLQKNDKAQSLLATIPADQQQNPVYHFLNGRLAANKGDSERAIKAFEKALEIDSTFAQAFIAVYNYALNDQFVDVFLRTARNLVNENESNLLAKNLLAQYLFFIQEFDESISLYKELVAQPGLINPAEAYNRLAIMHIETSLVTAKNYARQAYDLQPNSAKILDTYGHIKALQGDYEGSLRMLRDAFARDASDPNIRYHLGYTLAKLNRIEEAKKELEYAVNVERPFFKRPQARALLESL